ncbi:hypothetical protein [Microbacterium capsulatum]|uniref:GGDEF domain-containing protein n=1 Tax=Microbacterium capsulatum TaxID=3041921 RepID=A0ABU0XGP0_9MICO|nr:hypothetical protein [Microbacterium sp. ASV81]MDQ4214302.1 hypothetical protein [Microbacterium sp. ASV81]
MIPALVHGAAAPLTGGIHVDLSVSLIAVVTLTTALVVTLGLLPRPGAATVAWSAAFGMGMIGTYLWVVGNETDNAVMRALSAGLVLCFEPLIWAGVRHYAARRVNWIAVGITLFAIPALLASSATSDLYPVMFRIVFSAVAVFAVLVASELLRLQTRLGMRDAVMPLVLISGAFGVVAVLGVVAGFFGVGSNPGDELSMLRDVNGVGILLSCVCATVTILLLVREEPAHRGTSGRTSGGASGVGEDLLRDRLARAEQHRDTAWSVLRVRLDDPEDLREASGQAVFSRVVEMFHAHVREAMPATADSVWLSRAEELVLLPGGEEQMQHHLREVLSRVSRLEETGPLAGMRMSASIGWAEAGVLGFDLDTLSAAAGEAAGQARDRGGDRWRRARPTESLTTLEE